MKASASSASPSTLSVTCKINQALPPPEGSAPGPSPISNASPTRPVASGPVNSATAEARNTRSLMTCSSIRKSARIDSTGATPTGVSCATPTTCAVAPERGAPSVKARGAGRSPANGASASAVARPYSPSARRCGTRTTGALRRPRQEPAAGRSEEHTSELQSRLHLVCRLLLEKKKNNTHNAQEYRGKSNMHTHIRADG